MVECRLPKERVYKVVPHHTGSVGFKSDCSCHSAAGQTSRSLWEQRSRESVLQITGQAQGLLPTWPHHSDGGTIPRDKGQFYSAVGGEKQCHAQLVSTRGWLVHSWTSLLLGYDLIGTMLLVWELEKLPVKGSGQHKVK